MKKKCFHFYVSPGGMSSHEGFVFASSLERAELLALDALFSKYDINEIDHCEVWGDMPIANCEQDDVYKDVYWYIRP